MPDKHEEHQQKLKTKIRRLYDIANVLHSIGLIEKSHAENSKKPAFRWVGLQGTIDFVNKLKQYKDLGLQKQESKWSNNKLQNQHTESSFKANDKV